MSDIETVSTEDLVEELSKRFDHFEVCGIKCGTPPAGDAFIFRRWRGNSFTVMGLCCDMQNQVLLENKKTQRPATDDEG